MTVDVEDYFQVSAFAGDVPRDQWDAQPSRLERNTERILGMFADAGATATFFTLGWVAERYPDLIRRIVAGGHELASHGFDHVRVAEQTPGQFRNDVRRTRSVLQDTGGVDVIGYRAASFSIDARTPWAHGILADEGYRYSSSIYPIRHDHYGMPDAPRFPYAPLEGSAFVEIPITTVRLYRRNIPFGGGGYFRLLPYPLFRWGLRRVNAGDNRPAIFYFHPWEIDPDQPRLPGLRAKTRFRHYLNLGRTEGRLRTILADFAWDRMDRVFSIAHEGRS